MDTVREFVSRTHTRTAEAMPSKSIGLAEARQIASSVDWDALAQIAEEARRYLPDVQEELTALAGAHANHGARMRKRAVIFGLATPNRDESQAIAWAVQSEAWLDILSPYALAHKSYCSPVHGKPIKLGFYGSMGSALAYLQRHHTWDHATLELLEQIPGAGPKVARMMQAVLDPTHPTWTVDIWHMRQLLWASGGDYRVRPSVKGNAYGILEGVWLSFKARFFPDVPTFAVQWATWCVADGRFVSHSALWADLAA